MNTEDNSHCCRRAAYALALLGAILIVVVLVWALRRYTQPAPLNVARATERAQALRELRAAETESLDHAGWIDPTKDLVRLPIETAMKLTEEQWKNPALARSNLIQRVEKATYVPPPAPAKPSAFE